MHFQEPIKVDMELMDFSPTVFCGLLHSIYSEETWCEYFILKVKEFLFKKAINR